MISENRKSGIMYLDRILGSKTKVNALATLVSNPDKKFLESELSMESGTSVSEINRQLGDLLKVGIILMERQENQGRLIF